MLSVDGLATADIDTLSALPGFKKIISSGSLAKNITSIYPTQTYPIHASIITGTYPEAHGIISNARFTPGVEKPGWFWYRKDVQVPTLYDRAKAAGLSVGSLLWPGAAGAKIDFNFPEIKPTRRDESLPWLVLRNGTPGFVLSMLLRHGRLLKALNSYHLDNFIAKSAAYALRRKRPNLMLVHFLDLDQQRHHHGFLSPEAKQTLQDQDSRIGNIIRAAKQAGIFERTSFIILGDHGHMDVTHKINLNVALREAGLLTLNGNGRLADWQAWSHACGGSAQVYINASADKTARDRVYGILQSLKSRPDCGIDAIFNRRDIRKLRLRDSMDYMLEAARGYYFTNTKRGKLIEPAEDNQKSSHGYLPTRQGYQPLLLAFGAGIKQGMSLTNVRMIDLAPTMANLLGLDMPGLEGRVLSEMLEPSR